MTSKEMKLTVEALQMRMAELYAEIDIAGKSCFKLEDGRVVSVGYIGAYDAVVVEYADDISEAKLNRFEDGDLFYLNKMSIDELFDAIRKEIEE